MPPNPAPTPSLPCEQCNYINEPERVYCHNCGAKLDRSLLPKATEKQKTDDPDKARKRIAKITNPKSGGVWREIKTLFKVAFFSALVAAIYLIVMKPDGVPEPKRDPTMRLVSSDMMEALGSPTPRPVSFSDDDINQYLKQTIKVQDTVVPGIQLVHAYVQCTPGVLHITSEQSAFGYPIFFRIDYHLEVDKTGKFVATIVGGAFGRLSIDPQVMIYAGDAFGTLWTSLGRERKQMDKMLSVTVRDGRIDLVTKGMSAGR